MPPDTTGTGTRRPGCLGTTGAMTGTITIGLGTLPAPLAAVIHLTEVLVHGVDIAVAIDREDLADEGQSAALLSMMEELGGVDAYRMPGVFGAAVPVSSHVAPSQRLLAYLGRTIPIPRQVRA